MLSAIMLKIAMNLMLGYVMLSGIMLIQVMQMVIILNVTRLSPYALDTESCLLSGVKLIHAMLCPYALNTGLYTRY